MDFIIANVEHIEFKIERDLNEQFGSLPLPFPGMDSKCANFPIYYAHLPRLTTRCGQKMLRFFGPSIECYVRTDEVMFVYIE